jgi:VWFA-related protein
MVEVPVVVRDSRLRAVDGLSRDDFEVYDEGKKQAITAFSVLHFTPPADKPGTKPALSPATDQGAARTRFVALCFDDVHLLPVYATLVKDAAKRFVNTALAPGDRVAVVRTSRGEDVKFTNDVASLTRQIDQVTPFLVAAKDDEERCPAHFEPYEAYQIAEGVDPGGAVLKRKLAECTACYKECPEGMVILAARFNWEHVRLHTGNMLGMLESMVDGMAKLPGQRLILLASGGFLSGSFLPELTRIMEKAGRAEVVISELDARGLTVSSRTISAFDALGTLSSGTGGMLFHNNNDLGVGFRELGMQPETSYVLGFAGAGDGRFHKLKVGMSGVRGYQVEARLGYTALAADADGTSSGVSKLDSEVMGADAVADLPATFTWEQWAGAPGVTMIAHVDIARLRFKPNHERRAQRLAIIGALFDQRGNFVAGKRSVLELDFTDGTFRQFAKTGFTAAMTIHAQPGNYSVRAVVEDAIEGKLAAASSAVQIK